MLSAGYVDIAKDLNVSLTLLIRASGWMILTLGLSLFFLNPLSKIYGRRPIYLFAIVMLFISSIVGGAAKDFHDFQATRLIGAFGLAPFELLVQCTIGDMYFVHERATRVAFWNMFLLSGISAGTLIASYVIQNLGWQWCFWICAIFYVVLIFLTIFICPETCYNRAKPLAVQPKVKSVKDEEAGRDDATYSEKQSDEMKGTAESKDVSGTARRSTGSSNEAIPARMSYLRSLRVFSGRYSNASLLKITLRPFVLFFYPAVFVLFAIYGVMITWSVMYSAVIGVIFVAPPYNFSISQTGLTSLSPLILTIIGEVISGPLNDRICLYLTRKNKGIYEPEFRLVLIFVVVVLGTGT